MPPRSRSRQRSAPPARSTPTWPASTRATRASSPVLASSRASPRGDARDVGLRRQGAHAALGRARPQPQRPRPLPLHVLAGGGHLDRPRRGRHGTPDHLRRDPLRERGHLHADRNPRPARRRRDRVRFGRREHVNVDTIIQNVVHGVAELSFSVPHEDVPGAPAARSRSPSIARPAAYPENTGMGNVLLDRRRHALLSRGGRAMSACSPPRHQPAIISTSPIKISCMIALDEVPTAVRALHDAFELESAAGGGGLMTRVLRDLARPAPSADAAAGAGGALVPAGELRLSPPSGPPAGDARRSAAIDCPGASGRAVRRHRHRHLLGRRRALARVARHSRHRGGAVVVDNSSAFRMDDGVPLDRRRREPARRAGTRPDREPELLDDAADAPCSRHSTRRSAARARHRRDLS